MVKKSRKPIDVNARAVAAGVTGYPWTVWDIAALLD